MCVRERVCERKYVCERACVCVRACVRERECVCVCVFAKPVCILTLSDQLHLLF